MTDLIDKSRTVSSAALLDKVPTIHKTSPGLLPRMASQETTTSTGDVAGDNDIDVDMSESQISETQQTNMTVDHSSLNTPTTAIFPGKRSEGDDDDDGSAWLGSFWQVEGWEPGTSSLRKRGRGCEGRY